MTNIPVFLSADDNYAPLIATTVASVCDNTKSFVEFYVMDGGISEEKKQKIAALKTQFKNFEIEYIPVDIEKYISLTDYKNDCSYVSVSTYNRFLIPEIKHDFNKILYLDVDVIAIGDISELFAQNLTDYTMGAVPDYGCSKAYLKKVKKIIGIKDANTYFNAGILLINCEKWRNENVTEKLFQIEREKRDVICMADQDILNICFENNYLVLPEKFNVMRPCADIVIRHFAGLIKPWQADFYLDPIIKLPKPMANVDLFWKYAKMTPYNDHFLNTKKAFLDSNILYQRFNKMVGGNK